MIGGRGIAFKKGYVEGVSEGLRVGGIPDLVMRGS